MRKPLNEFEHRNYIGVFDASIYTEFEAPRDVYKHPEMNLVFLNTGGRQGILFEIVL